jgi:putative long chain acyl-CoA synthase
MGTRPSAITAVAALSRLGATAVLLRPDGDVAREVGLGAVTAVIADPEHVSAIEQLEGVRGAVLGGGPGGNGDGQWRDLQADAIDMERIDPQDVELPAWYRPNPHRASDIAFVLFTGEGASTKAVQITNRRWALSALGTASAAALRPGDTVYSVAPVHHSSALLMSIGGAVASGARFAMASADDPQTFWDEVRRYGATHVSYTWTSLAPVVDAPPHPNEAHHPIRMFMGSGMPRNLWRRVGERFPTARVLEFYASAEGEAILANVSGRAPGSMGRPLPGTAPVRVAAVDLVTGELELDGSGLARECAVDEVGLLLAAVDPVVEAAAPISAGTPLRGVFAAADAWRSTGDLFLRDDDGDLWLAGSLAEVVRTAEGPALPAGARFALGTIAAVDMVVAYGVPDASAADDEVRLLVAACTLRPGFAADPDEFGHAVDKAVEHLPPLYRPRYVQVVPSIPLTTWHRPVWRNLQAKGVPRPARGRRVWRLDDDTGHYALIT